MTIEFHCTTCQRLLRTADDKAGLSARCPQCGTELVVPAPEDAPGAADPAPPPPVSPPMHGAAGWDADLPETESAAALARSSDPRPRACPMCGERVDADASACPYCGEALAAADEPGPSLVARRVFSKSWKIFQAQMGQAIGGTVLAAGIAYAAYFALSFGLQIAIVAIPAGAQNGMEFVVLMLVMAVVLPVVMLGLWSFLLSGWTLFMLRLVRGEPAEVLDIFRGGRWWLRMCFALFIVSLVSAIIQILLVGPVFAGLLLFEDDALVDNTLPFTAFLIVAFVASIVSQIVPLSLLWPFSYLLVDQDLPGVSSVGRAFSVLSGNRMQSLRIATRVIVLILGGYLLCCIGLIFTVPLAGVTLTVAWCDLTGQPTMRV